MKKLFYLAFAATVALQTQAQAQNYDIVYQCGFEDGEDISAWDLQTVTDYEDADFLVNGTHLDHFYIGNAVAYESAKSLYVSEDNGISNNIQINSYSSGDAGVKVSIADLNINLSAGNYVLNFMYKHPTMQSVSFYATADKFGVNFFYDILSSTNDWTLKEISFSVPNGQQVNWIDFFYKTGRTWETPLPIIEGFAIDNIVIKKENQGQAVSQTSADNLSVFVNNRTVSVENAASAVQVLDISGRVVAQGAGSGIYEVSQAGVYIVKSGAAVRKVAVR
jgi:hypothetical protein